MYLRCTPSVRKLRLYWFWRQNIIGTKQEHIVHRTTYDECIFHFNLFRTYSYCNENERTFCWFFNKCISCARSISFKIVGIILSLIQFLYYYIFFSNRFFLYRLVSLFVAAIWALAMPFFDIIRCSVLRLYIFLFLFKMPAICIHWCIVCVWAFYFFLPSALVSVNDTTSHSTWILPFQHW